MTKANKPFLKCVFRDRRTQVESALWHDSPFFKEADLWAEGQAYRLRVHTRYDVRYGMQLDLLAIRPVSDQDVADGFEFLDLVPGSSIPADELIKKLRTLIDRSIDHPALKIARDQYSRREHCTFLSDARCPEFPPFLHVGAA